MDKVTVQDVMDFWEEHPLLGYELPYEPGSPEFFETYDEIRNNIEFKYCFPLLKLESKLKGKKVLDVGCGNGWLLSQFAKRDAEAHGIDLTQKAVDISIKRFGRMGLVGVFQKASAEDLPFEDNKFDVVTSLGVIHHTPETELSAKEIIRVCKPGGRVLIAVYFENLLIKRWFYPATRLFLSFLGRKDVISLTRQEFINRFDGPDNPLGKVYNKKQALKLLDGLERLRTEVHYFPVRFVPKLSRLRLPSYIERILDKYFGFLIYVEGYKPK